MSVPPRSSPTPAGGELGVAALAGMMLATSLAPLGSTMIAVALPRISQDTGTDVATLTPWLVTSYLIASIALQSPGGKLGDLIGHGRTLLVGLGLVGAGSVLGMLVADAYLLGAARVLTAAGGAATVPATMAILRNHTRPELRGRRFGLFGACMGLAAAMGPLVGGELTERFGWPAVFAANLPVVGASLLLVLASTRFFERAPSRPSPSFDWPGSAMLAAGLTLAVVATRTVGSSGVWLAAGGIGLLVAFPFWERRAPAPVVDLSLMTHAPFSAGGTIIALQNMAIYPLIFQLPVFFERVRGLSARTMGQSLLAMTLAMMAASLVAGRLAERIGARAQACAGSVLALVGLSWFVDFASIAGPADVLPGLMLLGAGVGLTSPPAQAASMSAVRSDQSGMAGGLLSTLRYVGGVIGTAVLSALLVDPSSAASHQRPVILYAGALVASLALSLALPGRPTTARLIPPSGGAPGAATPAA